MQISLVPRPLSVIKCACGERRGDETRLSANRARNQSLTRPSSIATFADTCLNGLNLVNISAQLVLAFSRHNLWKEAVCINPCVNHMYMLSTATLLCMPTKHSIIFK